MGLHREHRQPQADSFLSKLRQDQNRGLAPLEIDENETTEQKFVKILLTLGNYVRVHYAPTFLPAEPEKNRDLMAFGARIQALTTPANRNEAITILAAQEAKLKRDLSHISEEMNEILGVLKQTFETVL